jgi:hypothetical protein
MSLLGLGNLGETLGLTGPGGLLSSIGSSLGLTGTGGLLGATAITGWGTSTSAALAAMGGAYGPASLAQLQAFGGGGLFGGTGATFGSLLGGAGAGFGAGMLLNGLLGGNQTGGMVGSGLGAAAGAALGSTRGADNLYVDVDTRWFNPSEGTMIFEYVNRIVPAQTGGNALVYGGFGLTFNDTFYLSRFTTGQLVLNTRAGGAGYAALTRPFTFANAVTFRMAMAWANLDAAFCLDGNTVSSHALCPLPATPARIAIGAAPWSEPSASSLANATCRAFQYFPRRLSNALLQTLTAP